MFIGLDEHNSPTMSFSTKDDTCVSADPEATLGDAEWSHVAWRYDIQEQNMHLYINAVKVGTCGGRLALRGSDDTGVSLGASASGTFVGHLRDLRLFSENSLGYRAMPVTESNLMYISGLTQPAWEFYSQGRGRDGKEGCWRRSHMCLGSPRTLSLIHI